MSLFLPYGMNSALNDTRSPFGQAAADYVKAARAGFNKLEAIAKRAEPDGHAKAEAVGKLLMSGGLRAGAGANGNVNLRKRAQQPHHFPIEHDDRDRARFNQRFADALAKLPGHAGAPQMTWLSKVAVTSGIGAGVRKQVAANNSNLLPLNMPGQQGPTINEKALEVMNLLPDGRIRQGILTAVMTKPPQNPNDAYRWVQTIVALREQINEMCEQMGLDATALTDLLDRKVEFYDPMVQSAPETNSSPRANEDFDEWRDRAEPPAEDDQPGPFAGSDRSDSNPDFKLAKFYDAVTGRGAPLTRGEDASLQQLEKYGEIVVKAELGGALKSQILMLNATRRRLGRGTAWRKVMEEPTYQGVVRAIVKHPQLTRAMKGAALALIA